MRGFMKRMFHAILPVIDIILLPVLVPAALMMKMIRGIGVEKMRRCKHVLMQVGVFPIRNHYYEPLFDSSVLRRPLSQDRSLPGIDWNIDEQLTLLKSFKFNDELNDLLIRKSDEISYSRNGLFGGGDADFLYNLIRLKKPARLFEIGSGNSTLIALEAIKRNRLEDESWVCNHLCIEPYEMPWLEKIDVKVIRQKVEDVDITLFSELDKDDILFIDSSHIIRPQGDVVFEYLELLPSLKHGVIVHVHDIFSPKDYPKAWIVDQVRMWNEQYLFEAFLTCNKDWKVIGALNFLHHNHYQELKGRCPYLEPWNEPGSFYMQRIV